MLQQREVDIVLTDNLMPEVRAPTRYHHVGPGVTAPLVCWKDRLDVSVVGPMQVSGIDIIREVKRCERSRTVPVVVMSAFSSQQHVLEVRSTASLG